MKYEECSSDGDRLRWFRVQQDITQVELSKRAFVSQPSLSQYERDLHTPDRNKRRRLADALGVHESVIWHVECDRVSTKRAA